MEKENISQDESLEETPEVEEEEIEDESGISDSDTVDSGENDEQVDEESQPQAKQKSKSNFAKVISERNAYRDRAKELEEKYEWTSIKDVEAIMEQKYRSLYEEDKFYEQNPDAIDVKEEIESVKKLHPTLNAQEAYQFYLLSTNPEKLLSKQSRAKINAKKFSSPSSRSAPSAQKSERVFNIWGVEVKESELDEKIRNGEI